jgi:hypothetical protein
LACKRSGLEGVDRGGIRRWHHVGHRLRHAGRPSPNPKGDRVKITMSGKFLPYKYYGNTGNVPEYGYREE